MLNNKERFQIYIFYDAKTNDFIKTINTIKKTKIADNKSFNISAELKKDSQLLSAFLGIKKQDKLNKKIETLTALEQNFLLNTLKRNYFLSFAVFDNTIAASVLSASNKPLNINFEVKGGNLNESFVYVFEILASRIRRQNVIQQTKE